MTTTMEEANAALRSAVEARLAGCKPALEAATAMLSESCCEGKPPRGPSAEEVIRRFAAPHPSSQAFYDLCDALKAMHSSKSRDYGSETDPLANIRNGAEFVGIEPWKGAMVRLSDKVTRLATYNRTGSLTHESVEDNLMDLASYALLALLLFREERS